MTPIRTESHVLHIIPDTARKPRYFFLGSTKDVQCRTEYFQARGIAVDELVAADRSDRDALSQLRRTDLARYSAAVFELALFPRSMLYVKRHAPHILRVFRPGNAQLLHQLDGMRARRDHFHPYPWKVLAERTLHDLACARLSDVILSITDWESEYYWRRIVPRSRIRDVTYFVPSLYDRTEARTEKGLLCVCLTTAIAGTPFMLDATRTFARLVRGLGEECQAWSFSVTGDLTGYGVDLPGRIEATGYLDDITPIMNRARAVALLSEYGYGFKTKVLDAIRYGAFVLVPQGLAKRLPLEFRPYVIPVDTRSVSAFKQALLMAERPFPPGDVNAELRRRAFVRLDEIFAKERAGA